MRVAEGHGRDKRAWTATMVRSFFGPVQFSLQSLCSPRAGLLNTNCGWERENLDCFPWLTMLLSSS